MRKYDKNLVSQIKVKEYIKSVDGIDILMKPVPDDEREHVLDPRVLEIVKQKKTMFAKRSQKGFRLSQERYRPDKVTYDLTTVDIDIEERLIPINNDHMIDIYIYQRTDDEGLRPAMIYLHGGGWTAGDMRLYANQMKYIAELSHAVVIFPEYRLAPECPYPGPIDDAKGTIEYVVNHAKELRIDVNRLMVAGDSAGGGLTNSCLILDQKHDIKKAFEIYPAVDSRHYLEQKSYTWSYDAYPVIPEQEEYAKSRIDRIRKNMCGTEQDSLYLQGKTSFDNPVVSIVCASDEQLKGLPPVVVVASEYDFLRVSSDYFVKRLTELDKDVKSIRYLGCDHGFFDMLGTVVQAEDLCHLIAEEIKSMEL